MEDVPQEVEAENNRWDNGRDAKGRFVPGNPGKPIGSAKNKLRDQVREFLSSKWAEFPTYFDDLSAKEKCQVMVDLMPYAVPRLKSMEVENVPSVTEQEILRQELRAMFTGDIGRIFNVDDGDGTNS